MSKKNSADKEKNLTPSETPVAEKPRTFVVMATDGKIVSSPIKTTKELYMEPGNDKKN